MTLEVHFLNVGHGDCTVIRHASGNLSVIDINNGDSLDPTSMLELFVPRVMEGYDIELTNPVEFLKTKYPGTSIFRYIQTHPDLDHMRGLSALTEERIYVHNFWDSAHAKKPDFSSESDEKEWGQYQHFRSGNAGATVLNLYEGDAADFYAQDGIEILWPTREDAPEIAESEDWNNLSYVLRIRYHGVTLILGGDAEERAWQALVHRNGKALKCDVLKAAHHGRDSGYFADAVKIMNPSYTIVSVGTKPETDASNKYRQFSGEVWSTRWRGDISVRVDPNGKGTISSEYQR
jgi:beta-lactamase superfamily II metal-dependent hydrolase